MSMPWIIIALYFIGKITMHLIIYRDGEKGIDYSIASTACVAWPVTLLILCLLSVEKWIKRILQYLMT